MTTEVNQVCYVLTSNGNDIYADMNLISACSLRQSNSNIKISIICDTDTHKALQKTKHDLLDNIDDIISIKTPSGSKGFRNRYIKTSMRKYIEGPFLYLDADTLIQGDLSPVYGSRASMAAVANHNGTGLPAEIPAFEAGVFRKLNWPFPQKHYINGGVLFFSAEEETYSFFDCWHRKWRHYNKIVKKHNDQPSLNSALNDSPISFSYMKGCYNAQVNAMPKTAWGAIVWHFYLSDTHKRPITIFDNFLSHLENNKNNYDSMLSTLKHRTHPWINDNAIDSFAIRRLRSHNQIMGPQSWERLWLADQYFDALKSFFKGIFFHVFNFKRLRKP